jgi:HTH-type transcriptional regulator, competence development regulator
MEFGPKLRELRVKAGLGIKKLAPELGVSYTYVSKLENNEIMPSADLVERVAHYFKCDSDHLMLSAGKVPEEILSILRKNPEDALSFLRQRFGSKDGRKR